MIDRDAPVGALATSPSYRHQFGHAALIRVSNQSLVRRPRLLHNHPSGDPKPSRDDIEMTKEIRRAAEALGISIHDHLVIGRKGHASFRSLGLLS